MSIKVNNRKFQLQHKLSTNEYLVVVIEDGRRLEELTYYTDDKEDARGTLRAMVTEYAFNVCRKGTFQVVYK